MNKIIVLYASPIPQEKSISTYLAKKFIDEYKQHNKDDKFIEINLNTLDIAKETLTSLNFDAFFANPKNDEYIEILKQANKLVIAAPTINFNIPATLKNFIDHIAIANKTFSYKYSKKGDAKGLLDNLKVQIITTQGAPEDWYLFSSHATYLNGLWKFLGANVMKTIKICGLKTQEFSSKTHEEIFELNKDKILEAAKNF